MAKRTKQSQDLQEHANSAPSGRAPQRQDKLTYVQEAMPTGTTSAKPSSNWNSPSHRFKVGNTIKLDDPSNSKGSLKQFHASDSDIGNIELSAGFSTTSEFISQAARHQEIKSRLSSGTLLRYPSISRDEQFKNISLPSTSEASPISERLAALQRYADEAQGRGVADYVREHFPEIATLEMQERGWAEPLDSSIATASAGDVTGANSEIAPSVQAQPFPSEAPVKWKDREPGETAPDFTRRVYGPWLEGGISKRALRKLDAALVNELNTWVRNGNEMPTDIQLLTVGEENARLLSSGPDGIKEHLGKFTGLEAIREAQRLHNARYRQK